METEIKITQIKQNAKHESLTDLFADDRYLLTISKNSLIENKLYVGMTLDVEQVDKLKHESNFNKFYSACIDLISRRPRSISEVRDYLHRKQIDETLIDSVIVKLEVKGYLNDTEFAGWWLAGRRDFRSKSRKEIYFELMKKGVAKDIVDSVLSEGFDDENEINNIEKVFLKKMGRNHQLVDDEIRFNLSFNDQNKILNYLLSKGFSFDSVNYIKKKYLIS